MFNTTLTNNKDRFYNRHEYENRLFDDVSMYTDFNKTDFIKIFKLHYDSIKDKQVFFRSIKDLKIHEKRNAFGFLIKKHSVDDLEKELGKFFNLELREKKFIELKLSDISKERAAEVLNSFDTDLDRFVGLYFLAIRIDNKSINNFTALSFTKFVHELCGGTVPICDSPWFKKRDIKRIIYKIMFAFINQGTVDYWISSSSKLSNTYGEIHVSMSRDTIKTRKYLERVYGNGADILIKLPHKKYNLDLYKYLIEFLLAQKKNRCTVKNCGAVAAAINKHKMFIDRDVYEELTLKLASMSPRSADYLLKRAPEKCETYKSYKKL